MSGASARDRAHFAAIAAGAAEDEEERYARAAATPPGARMIEGIRLGSEMPLSPAQRAEIDARADGQMEISRRRIALGLDEQR